MLIQYKERNNIICKAIISLVCLAFLFNDIAICAPENPSRNCDTLAPTSRLDPLVNIKEHDGKYTISENKNAGTFLKDGFREDYAYLYLAELNGQFLKKISELLKLGMSPEGVQKHLDGFKRSIARDLGHVDFSRFHYKDMHADPESVYLPYEMNASEGGGLIWLRYYLDNGRVAIEPMDRRNRSTSVSVSDAPYRHILISGVPLEGRTLEDQMANLLANVDKALAENGCDKDSVVKQVVFLRGLADKRKSREMMGKHYGRLPPPATSYVIQAPANGELVAIEVIAIPKDSSAKVKRINANMVVVENDGVRFADIEGLEPTEGITDAREQALDIFKRMKKLLTDNGFKFENVARTWIYQGDITGSDPDGQQRYDKLNEARYIFFKSSDGGEVRFGRDFIKRILEDWMIPYPASTGISMNAGTFVMGCAAIDTKRKDVEIIPIENPRQTPVYLYEKKELRGKKINPLFSRGTAVVIADTATVWVSGTASIIKGKTVGDDAAVQAEETIENIRLVLNEVGGGLKDIAQARVYVKNQADYEKVRKVLEEKLGKTTRIDVIAGVCRQDLLVELEGVAYVKNPVSKMKKTSPKHVSNVLTADELAWIKEALGSLKPENWCHRTALIPAENGQVIAVRFLKRGKDISILENEVKVMRDMREAGLDVPEVLILPDGKYILTCDSAPANAVYDVDHSYRAIIYKATPKLFIYPEDIKHPDDMEMLALNSIGQFAEMLKKGFIHTSLSPLSHSEGLINPWRWNHKPLGGVENMEEAAAKSNIRLGGVNDFEHVRELSAGESAYDETVQAVCEWTVVVTYHSLKNGIPEEKTTEILKVGFDKLANVMGYGVPGIETIRTFVSNFHKEFKKQDIPFQNTAEAPVFDELVALVTSFVKKPHIGRNGLPMGPGAANITEPLSDSPAQEPRAVIFDIGKVLIDFDHGRMANALAQYSPHSASEILDIMEKSEATRLIRIGKISTNEFIARIKQEAALDIDSEEFLRIYNDQFTPKQDMIDFAFRLKRAGYKVAALSTISAPHYEHILRLLPAIQKLDGVFVSCKLGMAKPDPKIYEYVLEELGIAPHEAIFVDDVDENVTGARGSGMTAIKFAGYEALKTELEDLAPSREQNIALDFKDTLISKAYAARDKKETIILALDESWIPLYSGATGLIEHIGRYVDALNRRLGYEGVVFVSGKAEAMASEIARIREDKKAKNSNIIVLCKNDVLSAGGFNVLKGTSEDDSALLVGVNPANLKDISGVRIVEMFMLAMELNSGRDLSELDQTFIDIRAAGGKRMFVFTPIKPYDIGEFKKIYDLQIKALDINA